MWALEKFGEVFRMAQNLKGKIMDYDPKMKGSITVTCMVTEAFKPPQQMFNELKREKHQLPIKMLFHKVEKKKTCPLSKTLSHQHHVRLRSASHHRFRLLSFLHLPKMILMTPLLFRQKVNSQAQSDNVYTIIPLHLLVVGIVISSYHRSHRHHCHQ